MRAKNLAESLGARLEFIHWKFKQRVYSPVKYPVLLWKTIRILFKKKPSIIYLSISSHVLRSSGALLQNLSAERAYKNNY